MESYAPNILIVGYSGTGKSSSYENLPQDETTAIIETELKALPFKHKFPKVTTCETIADFIAADKKYKEDPLVKRIVYDSITKHLERCLGHCRTTKKGYDIWTAYGLMGSELMRILHHKEKIIIATSLNEIFEEEVNDTGTVTATNRMGAATLMGKELRGKIDKEFTIVVHTLNRKNKDGTLDFLFRVKPDGLTTAKTPKAMFADKKDGLIPNDVALILKELDKLS